MFSIARRIPCRWIALCFLVASAVGCNNSGPAREGSGADGWVLYQADASPCDDPLEARQGGCGFVAFQSRESAVPSVWSPDEPPAGQGLNTRTAASGLDTPSAGQGLDKRTAQTVTLPPRPPRRSAQDAPKESESRVAEQK